MRALVAASATTLVAWSLRPPGTGSPPPFVAAAWLLAVVVCFALAGRELSTARLATAVALSQTAGAAVFFVGSNAQGGARALAGGPVAWVNGVASPFHVMAGLAVVVGLRHAEVVVVGLARRAVELLDFVVALLAPPVMVAAIPGRRTFVSHPLARLHPTEPSPAVTLRGPPAR